MRFNAGCVSLRTARTDSKRAGDPANNQVAWIRRVAFDAADVVLVNAREFRESFLRQAACVPEVASPPRVIGSGLRFFTPAKPLTEGILPLANSALALRDSYSACPCLPTFRLRVSRASFVSVRRNTWGQVESEGECRPVTWW